MVTCGGQATIPMVAAVARVGKVHCAEIVVSISSRSAGPGTRVNIDEFTETTSRAIETVGGAERGKAIIVLNQAEPPMIMRDTVYCLTASTDREAIAASVKEMSEKVAARVAQEAADILGGAGDPIHGGDPFAGNMIFGSFTVIMKPGS